MLFTPLARAALATLAAGVVGCGLQTGGLSFAGAGGGTSTSSSPNLPAGTGGAGGGAAGTGGHATTTTSTLHGTGGGVDAGTTDAGTTDAAVDAAPTPLASCQAWLTAHPGTPSGVYPLLDTSKQTYQAYCEMVEDGGGWTLALKIDGTQGTFNYDADLWAKGGGLHPERPDLDQNEAELASYWSVPFTKVRVGMIDGGTTRWLVVSLTSTSFLDAINNGGATSAGRGAWEGLLAAGSLQTNCNWEGLNRQDLLRFGIVGDESTGCDILSTPDSIIGFGAKSSFAAPSGNTAHYSPDHGDRDTKTFGYLMVK